jgi:hypothetical protein
MCKNCGKQFCFQLSSGFGVLARAGMFRASPGDPRAARQDFLARVLPV